MLKSLRRSIAVGVLALGLPLGLIATSANAATIRPAPPAGVTSARIGLPPQPACADYGCWGQDPSTTKCNTYYMTFKPMSITVSGHLLATGQNVYTTGCNANWTEGTLTSYAISLGYTVLVETNTIDSQNPQYQECTSFPGGDLETRYLPHVDCWDPPWGYGGSTGWPAYTNMVDGTNTTYSFMAVYDSHGNKVGSTSTSQ